jgi:hypothetical protein
MRKFETSNGEKYMRVVCDLYPSVKIENRKNNNIIFSFANKKDEYDYNFIKDNNYLPLLFRIFFMSCIWFLTTYTSDTMFFKFYNCIFALSFLLTTYCFILKFNTNDKFLKIRPYFSIPISFLITSLAEMTITRSHDDDEDIKLLKETDEKNYFYLRSLWFNFKICSRAGLVLYFIIKTL